MGDGHFLHQNHEKFENGTINYLDLPAIKTGLEIIEDIGKDRITERISSLTKYLYNGLRELKHASGHNVVKIYGPKDRTKTGGTLIMSFFNPNGTKISVDRVESLANEQSISIRSGCFCNPGLDEINYCVNTEELKLFFATRKSGNQYDLMDYMNSMRGSTRVSVGIATVKKDLDAFINFASSFMDKKL